MASMNTNSPMHIKVLVVDDDWTSLSIVSSMLKKWSYEVVTVKSPVDAIATLRMRRNYFNLVVTDLHMPVMNGAELARQIKVEFKNIPVILMSADDKESVIVECLASGAVYYIIKPINPEDLKNVWQYAAAAARKRKSPVREEINVTLQDLEDIDLDGGPLTSSGEDDNGNDDVGFSSCGGESNKRNKASPRDDEDEGLTNSKTKKPKVIWTTVLHNLFLQAIRHIGLEKAVPKKILEFMRVPGLTRENVASHLQKYRLFLKRVAMRNLVSERALRSSFAVGHPSLMMARNAQLQQLYPNHIIGQQNLRLSTLGPPLFPGPRRHQGASGSHNLITQLHYSLPNPAIPFQPNSFFNNNNNMGGRLINSFNMSGGGGGGNNIMQLSHHRNNGVGYGINGASGMGLHMMNTNGMQLNANQHNVGGTSNYNTSNTCIAPMGHGAFGNLGQENQVSGGFGYPNQLMNPNHDLGHLMINGSDTFTGNFGQGTQFYPTVNNVVGPNQGGDDDENATGHHQVISNASVNINNNGGVEKSYSLDELMSSTLTTTNSTNSIDLDALFLDQINNPPANPPPNPQQQGKGKEVMNCNGSANYNYNAPRLNEDLNFDELPDLFPMELENNASWDAQSLPIQNHNQADVGVEVVNSNFGTTTPYPPYQIADHNSFSQNPSQSHLSQNHVGMRDNVYQPNHYNTSFLQNPSQQSQEGTGGSMDADLFAMVQNIGNTSNGSHHQYLNQQNWGDHDGLMQLVRSGGPYPNKE